MVWNKVSEGVVESVRVLALWDSGHIEDVEFEIEGGEVYHYNYEGECLWEQPTYWMRIPELPGATE